MIIERIFASWWISPGLVTHAAERDSADRLPEPACPRRPAPSMSQTTPRDACPCRRDASPGPQGIKAPSHPRRRPATWLRWRSGRELERYTMARAGTRSGAGP